MLDDFVIDEGAIFNNGNVRIVEKKENTSPASGTAIAVKEGIADQNRPHIGVEAIACPINKNTAPKSVGIRGISTGGGVVLHKARIFDGETAEEAINRAAVHAGIVFKFRILNGGIVKGKNANRTTTKPSG